MADRTIRTVLTLDPSQYESGMQRAAKASQGLGEANQKTATQSRSAMQRMAQSARDNRAEWQQVGGTLAGVGAATTGLMGVVAATGIGYNNLRQTATQGLTAVTGSTEAAAEQMRRLDEYGQNSWLMRDTLIRAQQQMTGFGIETEKVVPYMAALAEAVAATGGNNQTFEELAFIMAQIEGQSKITAQELREFGMRGIDAAGLIGEAMGKTGEQIRSEITDGSLDATVALDALATGMESRYSGASDLVRNTFRGAVDDVMAAFRDLSANVMAPLVDPEGGGLLVGLLNQVSDLLFALRDLPGPVLQIGGALTGLGGMATLAAGGFMLLVPRLVETWDALGRMGTFGPKAQGALRGIAGPLGRIAGMGMAAGVTAAAMGALMSAITRPGAARSAESVAAAIREMTEAGEALSTMRLDQFMADMPVLDFGAFEVAKTQADDLAGAMERIANPSITDRMSQFFGAFLPGVTSYMADYEDMFDGWGAGLTHLANTDLPAAQEAFQNLAASMEITTDQGALELLEEMPGFREALTGVAEGAGLATDDFTLLKIAMGYIPPAMEEAASATGQYEGALSGLASAQEEATDRLNEWRDMVGEADQSFSDIAGAYQSVIDANQELAEETASATESSKDSWEDFYDGASVSMDDWISKLQEQAEAQANWQQNILESTAQIREQLPADMHQAADAMLDELIALGPEGADAIATFTDASAEKKEELVEAWLGTGARIADDFASDLESARQPQLGLDTVPAETALAGLLGAVANSEEYVIVNGNPIPAENILDAVRHAILTTEEPVTIDGNDVPATDVLNALMTAIRNEEEDVTIDGNRVPADQVVTELMGWVREQEASVKVNADTDLAMSRLNTLDRTLNSINGKRVSATVAIVQQGQAAVASGGYMGHFPKFADGGSPRRVSGLLEGPGTTTSDSILARLSRKEFVVNAAATDYYGVGMMYALNRRMIPKESLIQQYAGGGTPRHVTQYLPAPRASAGAPRVSLEGMTVAVRVGERQFTGYVEDVADGRIDESKRRARIVGG